MPPTDFGRVAELAVPAYGPGMSDVQNYRISNKECPNMEPGKIRPSTFLVEKVFIDRSRMNVVHHRSA